jgi:hypothetical protein
MDDHDDDDSDLISEGASDDEQMMTPKPKLQPQGGESTTCTSFVHHTRWHRKVLVVLALIAIFAVWTLRNSQQPPQWFTTLSTDSQSWYIWAKSSAGEHFIAILLGLIVLDIAVDWTFGSWRHEHQ